MPPAGKLLAIGQQGDTLSLTNVTVAYLNVDPGDAYAYYQIDSDGNVYKREAATVGTPTTFVEQWVVPAANAGDYQVKATLNSGSLSTGTTGSWLTLTSDRLWGCSRTAIGTTAATLTLELRKGTGPVLKSATISLSAEVIF